MKTQLLCALALTSLVAVACDQGGGEAKPESGKSPGAPIAAQSASPKAAANEPAKAAAPAGPQGYDLGAVKTVADNCSSPSVILATAPKSVGASYPWNISRQALLANQQFQVVSGPPAVPGQIALATYELKDGAFALVATCNDGGTCNQLGAMYKAIVRSSHPQIFCGKVPNLSASPVGRFSWAGTPQGNLPGDKDTVALCGRLSACLIATDRATPGDPFIECQKAPSKFKTSCGTRYPCAEVMACLGN